MILQLRSGSSGAKEGIGKHQALGPGMACDPKMRAVCEEEETERYGACCRLGCHCWRWVVE